MGLHDRRIRVLVVYSELSHYRYGIFNAMDESTRISCTFAAGAPRTQAIPTISPELLSRFVPLKNFRIGALLWQAGVLRLVLRRDHDVIVFLGDAHVLSTWIGAVLARLTRQPALFWTIGWHRPERGAKRLLRLAFYRLSRGLMLYGNTALRFGLEMGYPRRRMTVIYNSIPEPRPPRREHRRDRSPSGPTPAATVVGAVARLTKAKRFHLLVAAAAELARRGTPVRLVLAGEGPERERLTKLALRAGVALDLPGAIYASGELEEIYDGLAVTVVPSAVGLTAIQSLAYGVPVITDDAPATQMPEWESVIPGETGWFYRAGDATSLADVIENWIAQRPQMEAAISAQCVTEVRRRWTPSAQLPLIEDAILCVADGRDLSAPARESRRR